MSFRQRRKRMIWSSRGRWSARSAPCFFTSEQCLHPPPAAAFLLAQLRHPVVLCFLVCFLLIDFLLSVRGASLRNIVAALCPTEGQTPQKPFKFTRDILPFLARFVNLKAMRLRSFRQVLRFIPLKMLFVPFLIFFLISVL